MPWRSPANALWAALLLASFVCTAASFLGRAVMAVERGEADDGARGRKSFFYAAGIVEGTETILAFVLFCLFPAAFPWLAGLFAALCFWTAAARVLEAWRSSPAPGGREILYEAVKRLLSLDLDGAKQNRIN